MKNMKKLKRILSLGGVIFLVGMYLVTFIAAITSTPAAPGLFKASIYCTVTLPVLLYAYMLIYRLLKNYNSNNNEEKQ